MLAQKSCELKLKSRLKIKYFLLFFSLFIIIFFIYIYLYFIYLFIYILFMYILYIFSLYFIYNKKLTLIKVYFISIILFIFSYFIFYLFKIDRQNVRVLILILARNINRIKKKDKKKSCNSNNALLFILFGRPASSAALEMFLKICTYSLIINGKLIKIKLSVHLQFVPFFYIFGFNFFGT